MIDKSNEQKNSDFEMEEERPPQEVYLKFHCFR